MRGDSSFGGGADLRAHKNGKNSFRAACGQGIPDVPPWLFGHMPGCRSGPDPPGTQKNLVSLDSRLAGGDLAIWENSPDRFPEPLWPILWAPPSSTTSPTALGQTEMGVGAHNANHGTCPSGRREIRR